MNSPDTSLFWLRVACVLYLPGLFHAILVVLRRSNARFLQFASALFSVATIFHLVSLVDVARASGQIPVHNFYETVSLCSFLMATGYLFVRWRYQFESISLFLFPLTFLLAFIGTTSQPVEPWANRNLRDAWLVVHVTLAIAGYVSLLLAASASVFYLVQERRLKAKQMSRHLPPLATLDNLLSRSMGAGFILITLATLMGSIWAFIETGTDWVADPAVVIAWVTWLGYLLLVFVRLGAGWRGRKVAITALCVLGVSALTWATHTTLRSDLLK